MMRDFGSPADAVLHGSTGSRVSSNRSSIERLYSSMAQSDDDDNDDNESLRSFTSGSSGAKYTPPLCKQQKFLFPQKEFVDKLRPEEIRWFYRRKDQNEKWSPFIGYDSLRIECRYRALQTVLDDKDEIDNDVIIVRGGLYQVDVVEKTCIPIYWSGDAAEILRGMWFYDSTWQPIEEAYSIQIETEHLAKFLGRRLDEEQPQPVKGKKPVLHHIRFQDFYIDWNGPNEVYEFSESTSSRIVRSVRNNLGLKISGSRIHRGYIHEAIMEDKPADISHLVFVIHGIGQKMETGNIVKRCHELRNRTRSLKDKFFPYFDSNTCNQRSEFLPVEWRTSLKLDGDTVESITPQKIKGIRTVLNSSAMDILYYTSPLYRSEVSAVISYDIISGWNPIQLYDKFVNSVIDEEEEQAVGSEELLGELEEAKKRVNELESLLTKVHDKQKNFVKPIENLFCLGSPLAVFLALRGIRPKGKGTIDHILPSTDYT
ncbi:hypothetical protein KUTeg_013378 [Tegillarca granosa]|uniref:C20G8.02-like WWE domain-containing protein n=1 Tax=Tegillarca granosa TaxID=220873 RepID=A0ABQ9ETV4_TEGGR|nr:hypothetical protein KUTeg_013378 [Tegillarca granosa]